MRKDLFMIVTIATLAVVVTLSCQVITPPTTLPAPPPATVTATLAPAPVTVTVTLPTTEPVGQAPAETCTVTTGVSNGSVNLRSCAGVTCPAGSWAGEGAVLKVLETVAGWKRTAAGWVWGELCP